MGVVGPRPEVPLAERFAPPEPVVIGLLGGIAAGKSTVAEALGSHGLRVIDADQKSREAAADPEIRARVADRFGPQVLSSDGGLDRKALADRVFGDDRARRDLEAILHPAIRSAIVADLEDADAAGTSVVLDVPLLLEKGLIDRCDLCIFVEASDGIRHARVAERGWRQGELERREATQAPLAVKKDRCAYTIRTDGKLIETAAKVTTLLREISASLTTRD